MLDKYNAYLARGDVIAADDFLHTKIDAGQAGIIAADEEVEIVSYDDSYSAKRVWPPGYWIDDDVIMCQISNPTVGFADVIMLDQYNAYLAHGDVTAADDFLHTKIVEPISYDLNVGQAIIFAAGDEVEIIDQNIEYSATRVWDRLGGYWVNEGYITCQG